MYASGDSCKAGEQKIVPCSLRFAESFDVALEGVEQRIRKRVDQFDIPSFVEDTARLAIDCKKS